ncbi:MAG: hypothetical protein ACD_18C00031G0001, partial [uncultured bacterium]
MTNQSNNTPKDVFLHLFNIFAFYLSVIAVTTLWVQYINKLFPDNLTYYYARISDLVTWSSAVIIITVPAFILTTWLLEKDIKKVPEKKDFKLRKWLLYFTIFLAGITFVVDLITFVMYFFRGELTTRFFLKILVVLIVAGAVFAYYMWDLKRKENTGNTLKILATILSLVVLGSIIAGFFIVGTPQEQRNKRFDNQRVQNLSEIQEQIILYWQQKENLPTNLEELTNDISGFVAPTDPETKHSYEYNVKSDLTFEICANFETTVNQEESKAMGMYDYYSPGYTPQNWAHTTG